MPRLPLLLILGIPFATKVLWLMNKDGTSCRPLESRQRPAFDPSRQPLWRG